MAPRIHDLVVVGAGPAGLAAATAAAEAGIGVLVIERESFSGGVLPQCVHDGFGLHIHGRSMTGPEYAGEWERRARSAGAAVVTSCTVLEVSYASVKDARQGARYAIDAVGPALGGRATLLARTVVIATGCRERTAGQLGLPGTRPAGVMTAGSAQYLINVENQLPGDKAVILGSGDIGLIMARRLTLEGAEVRLVLGQEATGLLRNHVRCIQDFNIPFRSGWGVASVHGTGRLKGVTVAPVTEDGSLDLARREYLRCNLLLIACGLVPEREVLSGLCRGGDDAEDAALAGLYLCGNARHPHDLADSVTQEGLQAGVQAASLVMRDYEKTAEAGGSAAGERSQPAEPSGETRRILAVKVREPKGRMSELGEQTREGRTVPCTVCPTGCVATVGEDGAIEGVVCERGRSFVRGELACPQRAFTGTVRLVGGRQVLLPVRTASDVPREGLRAVARECRRLRVPAPVEAGEVVARNIGGTGVDLIACAEVAERVSQ